MEVVENDRSKANLIVAPVPVRPMVGCNGLLHSAWPWPVIPPSFHHLTPYPPTISSQVHFVNSIFPSVFGGGHHHNAFGMDQIFLPKTSTPMKPGFGGYGSTETGIMRHEFRCSHCRKNYSSAPAFHMHLRTHMQGCECPICGKNFSRHWLLQGHIRTHTGKNKLLYKPV